jgi:hypothetical protein
VRFLPTTLNGISPPIPVCVVEVEKTPEPAFLKTPRGREFFIRFGNTRRALDPEQTMHYVQMNWE